MFVLQTKIKSLYLREPVNHTEAGINVIKNTLMKVGYSLFLMACIGLAFFTSCEDKDDKEEGTPLLSDNGYVNKWVYEQMDEWYLWRDQMPNERKLNRESDPETFFKSLLYPHESRFEGHYFSRIENSHDNLPTSSKADTNVPSSSLGFEYIPVRIGSTGSSLVLVVVYVHKKTNAATQGIKRGDVIVEVDGNPITVDNYTTLLSGSKNNYTLTINDYKEEKRLDLPITVTPSYEENPIYLDSIYVEGNRKIGYLVYNQYEFGNSSTRPYDVELVQKFTKFQQQGVTDLILDLRYNLGGYVASAQALCSALVPNRSSKNIFEIKSYNSIKQAKFDALPDNNAEKISYLYDYFVDNVTGSKGQSLASIPNLGDQLDNIYVLGTTNTASASELTINALRAYRSVVLVGETTTGKNLGGWALSKDGDVRNKYTITPIIFKSYNKNKESKYGAGFRPDIEADDFALLTNGGLKPLGDRNETLLNVAIASIKGIRTTVATGAGDVKYTKLPGSSLDRKFNAYKMLEIKEIN